jgi:hypothetical protein
MQTLNFDAVKHQPEINKNEIYKEQVFAEVADFILNNAKQNQELVYMLYNKVSQQMETLKTDNLQIIEEFISSMDITVQQRYLPLTLSTLHDLEMPLKNASTQSIKSEYGTYLDKVKMAISFYRLTLDFESSEKFIIDNLRAESDPELIFQCIKVLTMPVGFGGLKEKTKLPINTTNDVYNFDTFGRLYVLILMNIESIYSMLFEKFKADIYRAYKADSTEVKISKLGGGTCIAINKSLLNEIYSCKTRNGNLSDSEILLFKSYLANTNDGRKYIELRNNVFSTSGNPIEHLKMILGSLHQNLWIESKVNSVLDGIKITSPKDRKQYSKIKKELYTYYIDLYDEIDSSKKPRGNTIPTEEYETHDSESSITITPIEDQVDFYQEVQSRTLTPQDQKQSEYSTQDLSIYLGESSYKEYINHTSRPVQDKVNTIMEYVQHNLESNYLGKLHFAMRYESVIPMVSHQYCDMKFGDKTYHDCIKFNLNQGDRLLMYYDDNGQLELQYLSAQKYHNTRKM